jgi:hypothetical protein
MYRGEQVLPMNMPAVATDAGVSGALSSRIPPEPKMRSGFDSGCSGCPQKTISSMATQPIL